MLDKIIELFKCKTVVVIFALIIGLGSVYFLGNDNVVEEFTEEIIKEEIGANLDLTPICKK